MNEREKPVSTIIRTATIQHRTASRQPALETVQRYLPSNYQAIEQADESILIIGTDRAGWTLHGYVIPRLASGLISAVEGWYLDVPPLTITVKDGDVYGVTVTLEDVEIPVPATVHDHDRMVVEVVNDEIIDAPVTYAVGA